MKNKTNKDVCVTKCIISQQKTIGTGVPGDPYRRILQVFDLKGNLIAERDPLKQIITS